MLKNHQSVCSIADRGLGEVRLQLEYKAAQRGKMVVVVNRWDPSSKMCASCGYKMPQIPLAVREWTCPACHTHHGCNINAAINLRKSGRELGEGLFTRSCLTVGRIGDSHGERP
ncbi:MAG: zinc ribbon domain-containing protein [Firmicutes bacterium]|nr:zinc ribbon domain-containing protein [Bacillota bacterium]